MRIKRLLKSFFYAGRGLAKVFREEQNFRIELTAAAAVLLLAWWLKVSWLEIIVLIMVSGLVLLMEIINSTVELVSDALKPRLDSYVKKIKDVMAAAVLLAALLALAVGVLIFGRYLFN